MCSSLNQLSLVSVCFFFFLILGGEGRSRQVSKESIYNPVEGAFLEVIHKVPSLCP